MKHIYLQNLQTFSKIEFRSGRVEEKKNKSEIGKRKREEEWKERKRERNRGRGRIEGIERE
jgi:hypothetical protein